MLDAKDPNVLIALAEDGTDAGYEIIDVEDQPFAKALRATVNAATDPVWGAQILTKASTADVAEGDELVVSYYIRAESVGGAKPAVPGYFQKYGGEYEQLAYLDNKPTTQWTRQQVKAVAGKDYAAGTLTVSFHLGKTPQIIELAELHVFKLVEQEKAAPEPKPEPKIPAEAPEPQAVPGKANALDPDLLGQLGDGAELIIAGNRPAEFTGPGTARGTRLSIVNVEDDGVRQIARVEVGKATKPIWEARLTSPPTTSAILKGDVVFGLLDVRATSEKESGGGQFTAWLQAPAGGDGGGWHGLRKLEVAPGGQWSRRFFSAVADRDFAPGDVNFVLQVGVIPQQIEVANILLWNLGPEADLDALPRTRLTYDGQEPDAPWRAEAARRIDEHRKADLEVRVVDTDGNPVPNASVEFVLKRHAFGFATFLGNDSPALVDSPDSERFREILFKYHNRVTCPSYGAQTWGWPDPTTAARYAETIAWAVENGFETKAHPVVWSRFDWSPASWEAARDDPARLRAEIEAYITELMPRLASLGVVEVDFWNEPTGFKDLDQVITDPALRADLFKLGHELAPSIRLGINEHTILSAGGLNTAKQDEYAAVIHDLIDRGVPLGAIGMQGHMGEDFTPPTKLWEVLDRFAEFDIPIHVTEFDVNTEDFLTQADYTRDFMLAVFAHPAVESITTWGFWGKGIWIPRAEMWTADWQVKPNAEAFMKLLDETLHTHETVTTDARGQARVRGFLGEYELNVTADGRRSEARAVLERGGTLQHMVVDSSPIPVSEPE
ncbi:MAG: endo-1,4-beta-xylanase [Planctomycetota bacterium]